MADINSVFLSGNIGNPPEMKYFESGAVVVNFSVAVDEWRGNEKGTKTNWFDCRAWGKTAEFIGDYAKKGSLVMIGGSLTIDSFKAQDGTNRNKTVILINDIKIANQN
ncbi:MAG: single-stranded DNA-binding protein [Candidatus Gastranaerophilales bacterium]|nr:single-stranded DNA-binding protein [Candidatus Gastranaerophilales bacterium]